MGNTDFESSCCRRRFYQWNVRSQGLSSKSLYQTHYPFHQSTWFDGKSYIVAQYKSNLSNFYFFVYDSFVPEYNYFGEMNKGFGQEILNLNPENGHFSGKTYVYNTMTQNLYSPYAISPIIKSPVFRFEMK